MKIIFSAILVLICCIQLNAQQVNRPKAGGVGSWRMLGVTEVKHTVDHDIIIIAGPFDYFRKLKFKVVNAPLNMHRMIVRYDDGGLPENIQIRNNIPQGGESRLIDLRGGSRKLKSVEFWYDSKGLLRGRAKVMLFGLK